MNEAIFKTTFVVSNAQNIQAVIDKSIVYPTVLEMDTAIKKHNEAEDTHETVFNCYVKSVTEKNGTVTVTKGDGSSTTFNSFKLDMCYPVGSIYMSTVATSPADLFGGTWDAMPAGRVLLAQGTSEWGVEYQAGSTGGEHEHQLSVGELPSHEHNITISSAGNHKHGIYSHYNEEGSNGVADAYRSTANGVYTENAGDHTHTANIKNTGSDMPHNNMQPYLAVYMWKRTS